MCFIATEDFTKYDVSSGRRNKGGCRSNTYNFICTGRKGSKLKTSLLFSLTGSYAQSEVDLILRLKA